MNSRMVRGALALLVSLGVAVAGLTPRLAAPPAVLALDQTVTACDFTTFASTLAAVQADGGGTIGFDCAGTIVFPNQLTISTDVTINGNGQVIFDGNESTRFFSISLGARLEVSGLTMQGGRAFQGGAIYNSVGALEVIASAFTGNRANTSGGAIFNNSGTTKVTASTFSGNSANTGGGAINNTSSLELEVIASTFSGNSANTSGGAIFSEGGTVEVTASTFGGNHATFNGGAVWSSSALTVAASTFSGNSAGAGGAIFNTDDGISEGIVEITASTFNGNRAENGGAINNNSGTVSITAGTFSGNSASVSGGALYNIQPLSPLAVSATILADSTMGGNCDGALNSGGSNLSDDGSCGVTQGDANLAGLTDNGGPTETMLPQTPSDALDAADCLETTLTDQRGAPRPFISCDIGAVEAGATVPVQIVIAYNLGPILVDQSVEIVVIAYGPAGASLTYEFDCDHNGDYEINQLDDHSAACTFTQVGSFVVPVQVSDDTTSATGQTTVAVLTAIPNIVSLTLAPAPSGEGQAVNLSAEFTNPSPLATHGCEIDWGDGTVEPGSVTELDGSGTCAGSHVYADDDAYTVSVTITDDDAESDSTSVVQTVANLPPMIDAIMTNAPVPQGQPAALTVTATDPGVNDILTYSFDCDDTGSYETPGDGNVGTCPLNPAQASTTINVLVEDGDGGNDTGSVTVSQAATVCASYATGAISGPMAGGGCPPGSAALSLPLAVPMTICINPYTAGTLRWSPAGSCSPIERAHIVPDDGPLPYCQNIYTGTLRHSWNGQCSVNERAGVIPG